MFALDIKEDWQGFEDELMEEFVVRRVLQVVLRVFKLIILTDGNKFLCL
jgi:hypothetical protein